MKTVYIVLIRAHTGLGAAARRITGYPYTHISVSLDRSMTDFISFSRRRHFFPFDAGFTHEKREHYAFGKHREFRAKIFSLPVSDKNYREILRYMARCGSDRELIFNLFSMATMPLIGGFRIWKAENCMSFTAKVLELSGCVRLEKPFWRYSIKDMAKLLAPHLFFEGRLLRDKPDDPVYMSRFRLGEYLGQMWGLVSRLTCRMFFKH